MQRRLVYSTYEISGRASLSSFFPCSFNYPQHYLIARLSARWHSMSRSGATACYSRRVIELSIANEGLPQRIVSIDCLLDVKQGPSVRRITTLVIIDTI